jgi:gliding motility-associated-like protein
MLLLVCLCGRAQVNVTSSDTVTCLTPTTTLTAHVIGDVPHPSGITIDDEFESTPNPIGFTFSFYGNPYTQCLIGPNGNICFDLSQAGMFTDWTISAALLGNPTVYNTICGPWEDMDIVYGGTITYSTDGVAPNRKFVVTYCATHMYSCTTQYTTSQVIMYETTNIIEVHLTHKDICTDWNPDSPPGAGGRAILGVENSTGSKATVAPGRDWEPVWSATDEAWRFTPIGDTDYAVTSIGYAPIPFDSSTIYWYNATTGAYLGTGATQTVTPTTTTMYKAGALGCADTSFGYYTIVISRPTMTVTSANPTLCGASNGSITLHGLTAGVAVTVTYDMGGVAQPPVTGTVGAGGTFVIPGLASGTYSNIVATLGSCPTAPAGPVTLVDPPISISGFSHTNPTACGVCDGQLVLNGLYPSHGFTINYDFNGTAQSPVTASSSSTGSVTLTALCAGAYSNIVASFGTCVTPPVGPDTLVAPAPPTYYMVNTVNPSQCGYCDGSMMIKSVPPFTIDTVFYSIGSTVQTPFATSARGDSSIYWPGLCDGDFYNAISVKVGPCLSPVDGFVTMHAQPIVATFTDDIHYGCKGDTVFFHNSSTSGGALYYEWSFGDGYSSIASDPYHVYAQGVYTVTLIADNHICSDSMKLTDSMVHPLSAAFAASPMIACQGSPITFTNSSVGTGLTYQWNFGNGQSSTSTNTAYTYQNEGTYNVQLIATDFVPCSDTANVQVAVDSASPINILLTDSVLCRSTSVTFTADYTTIGNTSLVWNFGNGDSVKNINPIQYAFDAIGTYVVSVQAYNRACANTSTTKTVIILPQPNLYLGNDTSICPGSESLILTDQINVGVSGASWEWNTGETTPSITVVQPGIYGVVVDVNGCRASDSVVVRRDCYMSLPNVFTPNGDGLNDYFFPRQELTSGLTSFSINIFNRWGQLVFESTSLDGRGWDGKFNGTDQPEGVYVYIIDATFKDGQKEHHQGNVTLVR